MEPRQLTGFVLICEVRVINVFNDNDDMKLDS